MLLPGLATRFTDGYAAAAPTLSRALRPHRAEERHLDWLSVAYYLVAIDLWDDEAWHELASGAIDLARATAALLLLPYALEYLAGLHIQAGELSLAAGLLTEAEGLDPGLRTQKPPYMRLRLAAWRGQASTATSPIGMMTRAASARGEGGAITAAEHAAAILYNGLGEYDLALDAAQKAAAADELMLSSWTLYELVEAAARLGRLEVARDAVERLSERTGSSGTAWAKGTEARSRALVEDSDTAEDLYRQAIEWLSQCRMAAHLARARLSYGEWLRRQGRRVDARRRLRGAYDVFASMGADGFADRARHELSAIGEKVPTRAVCVTHQSLQPAGREHRHLLSPRRGHPPPDGRVPRLRARRVLLGGACTPEAS